MSDNTLVSDYGMCEEEQVARIAWFLLSRWIDAE
ncbi:Transcriptional regulator lsrR [Salmonella enterica subsp. enterica]|uniref:Transcriptional regulator lsrR n=1 Tax=Salmonella enterica I TaxID=59201 RepID=A0A447TQT0_SALET|nr:Transcriptional regulator lsrR [Salmonella enterica subsp. enterica]